MRKNITVLYKRFCLVACIVWALLWARSYTAPDAVRYTFSQREIKLVSLNGRFVLGAIGFGGSVHWTPKGLEVSHFNDLHALGPFDNIDNVLYQSWLDPPNPLRRFRVARSHFGPLAYQSYGWAGSSRLVRADTIYLSCHFWLIFAFLAFPYMIEAIRRIGSAIPQDPNLCARCGYDLRATPTRCPECGTLATPPRDPAPSPT